MIDTIQAQYSTGLSQNNIERALVSAGVVRSVDEAFATLLNPRSPYYVAKADTDVLDGIALSQAIVTPAP